MGPAPQRLAIDEGVSRCIGRSAPPPAASTTEGLAAATLPEQNNDAERDQHNPRRSAVVILSNAEPGKTWPLPDRWNGCTAAAVLIRRICSEADEIVDAFMVVVLGGVGNIIGTVAGALGIGVFNTAFEYTTSATIGKVLVFTVIIAFLQWKPSGLVNVKSRTLD